MKEGAQETEARANVQSDRERQLCRDLMRLFHEWKMAGKPMRDGAPVRASAT